MNALEALATAGIEANCDTTVSTGSGANDAYFYSSCTCENLFKGVQGGAIQRGQCLVQRYVYDIANGSPLEPLFPASSPFVLSVGGLTIQRGSGGTACDLPGALCPRTAAVASSAIDGVTITSGGGFAAFSAQPDWQADEVADYLGSLSPPGKTPANPALPISPPAESYDKTRRAYPDVSSIAAGCLVYTSASRTGECWFWF
jgi:hypothetical protein